MSTYARASIPGSRSVRAASATRCVRAAEASWLTCPGVNSRKNWPNVAGAYTPVKSRFIPPERTTCRSSILSAPAAIPAVIELTFPAGFTPAEATTRYESSRTLSSSSCDSPVCSARPITGASPAHDARFSSSKTGVAFDHA